jgi:hypothetical protein
VKPAGRAVPGQPATAVVAGSALAAVSLMMACDGFHAGHVSAGGVPVGTARGIDDADARRDACLARNAAERALASAPLHARAQALALACATETKRPITTSSRGHSAIAGAIRDDSAFRALGVVLRTPAVN